MKEIQIKNFRSLKDTELQTLSPITILVGENSSGKSTFLRAFPLLKQSINKRTSGPILWAGDVDDYVDFGSFEDTVTNDGSNTIAFRFKFDLMGHFFAQRYMLLSGEQSDEEKYEIDYEIVISSLTGKDTVEKFNLGIDSLQVQFDLTDRSFCVNNNFSFTESGDEKEISDRGLRCALVSTRESFFGFSLPNISVLIDDFIKKISLGDIDDYRRYGLLEVVVSIGKDLSKNKKIRKLEQKDLKRGAYPSWYIDYYNRIVDKLDMDTGRRMESIIKIFYLYIVFIEIEEYIIDYFKQVHYMAPLRATAERYYRLRNLAIDEVDYQGKNLAIFINSLTSKQMKDFQNWTNEHLGFAVQIDKSKGHLSLLVKLKNADEEINLSDTGFGYSQVLPIITQLWELSSQNKTKAYDFYGRTKYFPLVVAIEQPELHLHPAVQARLAKAFIACIKLARENGCQLQLLLETHSETIINYFGRAIAKGFLEKDDVSVILFEKEDEVNVTVVKNSYYDENGFLVNWPYGFFEPEE